MISIKPYLVSPALPAATLLFGTVFFLAFFQFAGLRWHPAVTVSLYSGLLAWVTLIAWNRSKIKGAISVMDVLFGVFILLVVVSLFIQDTPAGWKYGRYLPFLALVPYVCGRLMCVASMALLFKIVASAGTFMLLLLLLDYYERLSSLEVYSRWPFFGHDFALVLIAILIAASLIVLTAFFLAGKGKRFTQLTLSQIVMLVIIGLMSAALVTVAARGAILAGMAGIFILLIKASKWSLFSKINLILYFVLVMIGAYLLLPKPQIQGYTNLATMPEVLISAEEYSAQQRDPTNPNWIPRNRTWDPAVHAWVPVKRTSKPILGPDSCRAVDRGINSLAIRWTLYQEAWAIFWKKPLWGVGAASFGRYSCAGETGFPHSTTLQAFSELGMVGGILYCSLLLTAFLVFVQKAFMGVTKTSAIAQLSLSLFLMYLLTDQLYGNYFLAVGSYFFVGVAAGMQINPAWNEADPIEGA